MPWHRLVMLRGSPQTNSRLGGTICSALAHSSQRLVTASCVACGMPHLQHRSPGTHVWWLRREAMTRVAVQDMATGARASVDCGGLVHKVAVYARRLAVQLSARLLVYAVPAEGDLALHMHARITAALPCNLLLVAEHHLLLCQA